MTELKLARCTVRPWRVGDEISLERYANNRNVSRNLRDIFPYPYTTADATAWIERVKDESPTLNFAIDVDGAGVGGISVMLREDIYRQSAEIGYWLGEPFWGRGIATESLRAITDHAFATFPIIRLEAGVYSWNPASARVLEKVGYTLEGRLRQAVTKDGRVGDRLIYGLLRP